MTEVIFVRHGESQANATRVIATDDSPLSEVGMRQAQETGKRLAGLGIEIIASSPYLRARQTARIIAAELQLDLTSIIIIDELRERDMGDLKGEPKLFESTYYFVSDEHHFESRQATLGRMSLCLEELKKLSSRGKVLAIGHAVSGYYLQQVAKGHTTLAELDHPEEMMNASYHHIIF